MFGIISRRKRTTGYSEDGIAPALGAGDRAFEPRYSDQKPLGIHDLKGLLLFLWRCFILFAFIKKPDREKDLRTWDSEDVLAVYDALVRAHESINKLALVPDSF